MNVSSRHQRQLNRQRGLSLIELMVAMVIGCVLILGVTQIFISNQKSYMFQQGQVANQENGRFALSLFSQELSKAGYRSNVLQLLAQNNTVADCNFVERAAVVRVSDTALCIQYQANNRGDATCQGTALSAASKAAIVSPYKQLNPVIIEKIAFDAATNAITCTTGGATAPLVSGVKDVRFEYGWNPSAADKIVNTYAAVPNGIVRAVRYSILMQSPSPSSVLDTADISPALKEWNTRYSTAYDDNKSVYQIVQGTFMVRNLMP